MHVVLSGYYGFHNVGDEAILFSIIQALKSHKPDIEITVLSNDPEYTEVTYSVNAINRWDLKAIFSLMKRADGLISGGGSLLQDITGMKSIPYYTGIIKIAQTLNKPVFVYAQGMGPITKPINKWITKSILNKVTYLSVRDEDSRNLLQEIGVKNEISLVPDPVMGLAADSFSNSWVQKQNFERPYISVSVRDWPSDVDYKGKIAEALDGLSRSGYDIVFIPMHGEHDFHTSKEIAGMMQEKSAIAPYDAEIQEKISIIGESELLVGMRLHALIFSAISHTPFVALSYDPKIDAFAGICSQPVAGHVKEDNWGAHDVITSVNALLEDKPRTMTELQQKVSPLQTAAVHTAEIVIQKLS
jgi:polysaccharide pyruvyl transferase CsaB